MNTRTYTVNGSRGLMIITTLLVGAGTLVSVAINPFAARTRAKLAQNINFARQVKFALDAFAVDFDGQYPNADTGEAVVEGGTGTKFSNDYFRQLFLAGCVDSEVVFWVKGASVCNPRKPDDIVARAGRLAKEEILKAGDCGWAYMSDQTNTDHAERPLVLSSYRPGTSEFDAKLHDGKVIVVTIDGAAQALKITKEGTIQNADGENPLSVKSKPWRGSGEDPAKSLRQPQPPAKKPQPDPAGAAAEKAS